MCFSDLDTKTQEIITRTVELHEAKAEITRHHQDFLRIREALDDWHAGVIFTDQLVRRIENVVG